MKPTSAASARCKLFRQLHASGCFVMPNPWDRGSARLLAQLGFPALPTTSSGFAWSHGLPDGRVSMVDTLAHVRSIAEAVPVPVNADFQDGFAIHPAEVALNVAAVAATGIAGLSIEDSTGDASDPLFERALAIEVIQLRGSRGRALVRAPCGLRTFSPCSKVVECGSPQTIEAAAGTPAATMQTAEYCLRCPRNSPT